MSELLDFYNNKTVLITGCTGFKGTWLTRILLTSEARVIGYSLEPPTNPSLFQFAGLHNYQENGKFINITADIRDLNRMKEVFAEYRPEIVFHLAAQPIVRDSYKEPVYTYETNVMGTVNVLECIRFTDSVRSSVIITTDKVYKNNEWIWGYREDEPLDGFDPYSNSKSCAELAVHSYRNSFFNEMNGENVKRYCAVSTARAGNVIGGGDFAHDRIIPDCVRAMEDAVKTGKPESVIAVRNPYSTRPYQHVLEPLAMYLTIAYRQWDDISRSGYYNVGPDDVDCVTTGDLVDLFCKCWNSSDVNLPKARWESHADPNGPHEANFLKLDSTKIKVLLGYKPRWHIEECVQKTVTFSKLFMISPQLLPEEMDKEIKEFFE